MQTQNSLNSLASGLTKSLLAFAICLCVGHAAWGSDEARLSFDDGGLVVQEKNKMDCGPAAIFNSFSIGNDALKSSIKALNGKYAPEKYMYLVETLSQKPSVHFAGENLPRTQRQPGGGTFVGDMDALLKEMISLSEDKKAKKFTGGFAYRRDHEETYLARIHGDIVRSLEMGYPPIINRAIYAGNSRRNAHYVVIHAVSKMNGNAFTIKVYDSIAGNSQEWRVEESSSFFTAYSWEMNRPGMEPVVPADKNGNRVAPFLKMSAEDGFAMRTNEARYMNQESSSYMILEQLFGQVENPDLYEIGDFKK